MARIAGVNIPDNKHAGVSLTYIFGVGRTTAAWLCDAAGVNPEERVQDLSEADLDACAPKSPRCPSRAICGVR